MPSIPAYRQTSASIATENAIARKPTVSFITPLATSPTRAPSAPNQTFMPTIPSRSLLSCEISGSIAS